MKFILPKDLAKYKYYCELLSEVHGVVELNRLHTAPKWKIKRKVISLRKIKEFENDT